jgi:pimeloyl-ACP methyl ester carboxylesterase
LGPRSAALIVVLAIAAAALLAGMLWLWPPLARRRAGAVLARIALLGGLQLSVLGLVFVYVNRTYEFYAGPRGGHRRSAGRRDGWHRLAARQIKPMVIVMLGVSPLMPLDTECTDIPAGPQVESFLAQDVPRAIQHTFRVTTSSAGWGVIGYSTGGYCAAKLAMMYPDRYSAAVSMAGYYQALRGQFVPNLWGGSLAYRLENSPDWRLKHLPALPVSILATSSRARERSLPGTLTFLEWLSQRLT